MTPRQRGNDFESKLQRVIEAVWVVMRDRAKHEATAQPINKVIHRGRRPNHAETIRRPDLNRRVFPGSGVRQDRVTIGDPEFVRAVRQYLHDELTDTDRRRVPNHRATTMKKRKP